MEQKATKGNKPYDYQPLFSFTEERIKNGKFRGYNTYHVGIVTVQPCQNKCNADHIVFAADDGQPYVRCSADQNAMARYTDLFIQPTIGWGRNDAKRALRYVCIEADKNGENPRNSWGYLDLSEPQVRELCRAHLSQEQFNDLIHYFETMPDYVAMCKKRSNKGGN